MDWLTWPVVWFQDHRLWFKSQFCNLSSWLKELVFNVTSKQKLIRRHSHSTGKGIRTSHIHTNIFVKHGFELPTYCNLRVSLITFIKSYSEILYDWQKTNTWLNLLPRAHRMCTWTRYCTRFISIVNMGSIDGLKAMNFCCVQWGYHGKSAENVNNVKTD